METLLSALRSVAPHVAQQFERGELNVTGPSGSSAPPQNADPWQSLESNDKQSRDGANGNSFSSQHDHDLPSDSVARLNRGDGDPDEGDAQGNGFDNAGTSRDAAKRQDRGALLPDVEDGRPRFYGRSSAMTLFHNIADESRPPSPGAGSHRSSDNLTDHAGISYETYRHNGSRRRSLAYLGPHYKCIINRRCIDH